MTLYKLSCVSAVSSGNIDAVLRCTQNFNVGRPRIQKIRQTTGIQSENQKKTMGILAKGCILSIRNLRRTLSNLRRTLLRWSQSLRRRLVLHMLLPAPHIVLLDAAHAAHAALVPHRFVPAPHIVLLAAHAAHAAPVVHRSSQARHTVALVPRRLSLVQRIALVHHRRLDAYG